MAMSAADFSCLRLFCFCSSSPFPFPKAASFSRTIRPSSSSFLIGFPLFHSRPSSSRAVRSSAAKEADDGDFINNNPFHFYPWDSSSAAQGEGAGGEVTIHCASEVLLRDKMKHLVASWVSPLASFRGLPVDMIQRNWKEVAFSSSAKLDVINKWVPPPTSSLKLNFDGSACGNPSGAGVGGIIQNDVGQPILSFSVRARFSSANVAELLTIRIALGVNLHNLVIQGDSFCAIQRASGVAKSPWKVAGVVGEIFDLVKSLQVKPPTLQLVSAPTTKLNYWPLELLSMKHHSSILNCYLLKETHTVLFSGQSNLLILF